MLVMLVPIMAIMYFVLIRPQSKQAKELQAMRSALKKGDDVVTSGGILGKIFLVTDKTVTLDLGSGNKVRVLKQAISGKATVADDGGKVEELSDKLAAEKKEGA